MNPIQKYVLAVNKWKVPNTVSRISKADVKASMADSARFDFHSEHPLEQKEDASFSRVSFFLLGVTDGVNFGILEAGGVCSLFIDVTEVLEGGGDRRMLLRVDMLHMKDRLTTGPSVGIHTLQ